MFIREWFKNNNLIVFLYDKAREMYYKNFTSDEKLINKQFKKRLGREANLENPVKFNDKIQWLKLYWHDSLATKCADKYEVRKVVSDTIGSQYLNDLIDVYESVEEIDIKKLPNSFVLKGTHGSGFNIICKDKNKMDWNNEFKKMRRWLWKNYYWSKREWVYKDIKPRIIAEKYLSDENGNPPMDYKIFCFHGEPKLIQVDIDRFDAHRSNIYDVDWNLLDIEIKNPSDKSIIIKRPSTLKKMLELSRKLSEEFPHVRVDFYEVKGNVVFGELTFFHHSGMGQFNPPEFEEEMGSYLDLSKIRQKS